MFYACLQWSERAILDIEKDNRIASIALIKRMQSKEQAIIVSVNIVKLFVKHSNVGKTMNAEQIIQCAKDIVDTYYYLDLTDFAIILYQARSGMFGKQYDVLDQTTIFGWIDAYWNAKIERMENENKACANKLETANNSKEISNKTYADLIATLQQKFTANNKPVNASVIVVKQTLLKENYSFKDMLEYYGIVTNDDKQQFLSSIIAKLKAKNKGSNEAQASFANQLLEKFKQTELSEDEWHNTIDEIIHHKL